MTTIVIDAALREKLLAVGGTVELHDEAGTLVALAYVNVSPPPTQDGGLTGFMRKVKEAIVGALAISGPSYERFTDRSRKVMQLANQEAHRFRHEYIGTEHVLLGLVAEGAGVAANVFKNLDVDVRKVRSEVEKIIQFGPGGEQVVMGRLPHTPRTKKVIDYAIEEARSLRHNYVGTEHLLLGLLRETEGVAAQVLMNLGLKLEVVRLEVMNLLGQHPQ